MELVQQIAVSNSGSHSDVVCAVARASAKLLLAEFDHPQMQAWLSGRFTKTVRRGSFAKVDALAESIVPNATAGVGLLGDDLSESIVRAVAFLPMARDEVPPALGKLRVADFNRPHDGNWSEMNAGPSLFVNGDVEMSTGKTAAQVAHALCAWLLRLPPGGRLRWLHSDGTAFRVREVSGDEFDEDAKRAQVVIRDAGLTEVESGTATVLVR